MSDDAGEMMNYCIRCGGLYGANTDGGDLPGGRLIAQTMNRPSAWTQDKSSVCDNIASPSSLIFFILE
eukprot:scaffold169_cov279-Chaetoceros_neogracile.AAC.8